MASSHPRDTQPVQATKRGETELEEGEVEEEDHPRRILGEGSRRQPVSFSATSRRPE